MQSYFDTLIFTLFVELTTYFFSFFFSPGVPDAPEQPIIKDVTKDSAVVVWNKPYDGGKPITNYIVEKKETMAPRWVRVTKDSIFPGTQFKVPDLLEGCQYEFRVSAENEIGVGDPSPPSKPIFARDPIGKVLHIISH